MAKKRKNTLTKQIWHRLKKDDLAVAGLIILTVILLIAITAPWILPYNFATQDLANALQPPSLKHLFGTDNFGRDLFSRVLYGSRFTLLIGFGCGTAAMFIGIIIGRTGGHQLKNWICLSCE